jgi:hypothetical protein
MLSRVIAEPPDDCDHRPGPKDAFNGWALDEG